MTKNRAMQLLEECLVWDDEDEKRYFSLDQIQDLEFS